jgi:hypothetical protein
LGVTPSQTARTATVEKEGRMIEVRAELIHIAMCAAPVSPEALLV